MKHLLESFEYQQLRVAVFLNNLTNNLKRLHNMIITINKNQQLLLAYVHAEQMWNGHAGTALTYINGRILTRIHTIKHSDCCNDFQVKCELVQANTNGWIRLLHGHKFGSKPPMACVSVTPKFAEPLIGGH